MSTEQIKLNSFSIEEMARYQKLQSEDAADPLLTKVQMHSGPLPLPFVNDNSPVFLPDAVGALINRVVANYDTDGYKELLYWTLRKLEHSHMMLPPQCIFPLAECVCKLEPGDIGFFDIGLLNNCISYFMLFEQIFKVGGPGLRYVLQQFAPEGCESVFVQPEFVAHLDAHDGQVDYDYLLEHANFAEVQGAFMALRWQDPTRARELVQKYWDNERFRGAFLEAMQINLSLADEPFLSHIIQTEESVYQGQSKGLLRLMVGSNFAKRCAQQFLAHVQYLGPDNKKADKGGLKIERFAYSDELKALGVRDPKVQKPTISSSRDMLLEMLWEMDLPDLLALTGHANEPQVAIDILARHMCLSPLLHNVTDVRELLLHKIYLAKDTVTAEAFLQQKEWFNEPSPWTHISLAQLFAPEKREQYLWCEQYPEYVDALFGHFFPPEAAGREIDFNPLQDTWAKQLLDMMYKCCSLGGPIEAFMFWPYSMIDVIKQYIAEQEEQDSKLDKLEWLENMLAGLELKQQIDELVKTVV